MIFFRFVTSENERYGAWGMDGEEEGWIQGLMRKPEEKRPFGRPWCRWNDNIKLILKKSDDRGWTGLTWDTWPAFVNKAINILFPWNVKNFILAEDQSLSPEEICSTDIVSCWWCPCSVGVGVWLWGHADYMNYTGRQYEHSLRLNQNSLTINKKQNIHTMFNGDLPHDIQRTKVQEL